MVRLLALLALAACSRADAPPDRLPSPKPDPIPTPPGPYPMRDDQPLVLLQLHDGTSAEAEFAFVELNADPKLAPRVHPLGKRSVYGNPSRRYFQAIASYHERRWARIASAKTVVVEAADPGGATGGKSSYTIGLPVEPRAIHLVGDALYVGTDKAVCWVDLAMSRPDAPCVELVARAQSYKSYDVFVHHGDRLAAIDDEVMPMYADWFALDAHGKPTKHLGDWTLPGTINGHYPHAALHADTLYLVSPFSVLRGDGQLVTAVPIRDDKLVFGHDLVLQNPDGITPVVMEVTDRRGYGAPPIVLAGSTMTPWTALAIVPDAGRVLLAAGTRGILSLGLGLRAQADAFPIGNVSDVIARGDRVLALAGGQLITLDPTTLAVLSRTALPAAFDRFVR